MPIYACVLCFLLLARMLQAPGLQKERVLLELESLPRGGFPKDRQLVRRRNGPICTRKSTLYGKRAPKIGQPENEIHVQIHELVLIVQEPHSMTRGVRVGLNVLDSTVVVKVYVRSLFIRESFYCPQEMVCFARGIYFEELDSVDVGWGAWFCCELKPRPQLPPGKKPRCTKGQRSLVNP